jgi:hypothetical protein
MLHRYWAQRNNLMAKYIDNVACNFPDKRIVVFFGAGHIGSVQQELKKLNRQYEVLTLPDLMR